MTSRTKGPGPWCGTPGGYNNHACRCDRCRQAQREDKGRYMFTNGEQRSKQRERRKKRWNDLGR